MSITWDVAEKNLTSYVAGKLQLTLEHTVFRSAFPEESTEGVVIAFSGGTPATQNKLNECEAVIQLHFSERAALLGHLSALCAAPLQSLPAGYSSLEIIRIAFAPVQEPGVPRFQAELRLAAAFL